MSWLWNVVTFQPNVPSWSFALHGQTHADSFSARLPSQDEGLWFTAEFDLTLQFTARDRRERQRVASVARTAILQYARRETRNYSVADVGFAQAELESKLRTDEIITEPEVRSGTVSVTLSADDQDTELVRIRERYVAQNEIKAEEHRSQMRHLRRLTEDVYSDRAVALRWWYDQNPGHIRDLDMAADRLELVLTEERDASDSHPGIESVGPLVNDLLRGLDSSDRAAVLDRLALLFGGFGRRDLTKRLRAECPEEGRMAEDTGNTAFRRPRSGAERR